MRIRTILVVFGLTALASSLVVRANSAALELTVLTGPPVVTETPVSIFWSKGSEDGSSVFQLAIYPPWEDATQRTIAFYAGFVTRAGLAGMEANRLSELAAADHELEAAGETYKCTAKLNGVASWSEVRKKADVTLTVAPVED